MTTVEREVLKEHQAAIRGIREQQLEHTRMLRGIEGRLGGVDERLGGIDERLGGIDERLGGIEAEQRTMVREMAALRDFLHERLGPNADRT